MDRREEHSDSRDCTQPELSFLTQHPDSLSEMAAETTFSWIDLSNLIQGVNLAPKQSWKQDFHKCWKQGRHGGYNKLTNQFKSLVWGEKIEGVTTIVANSRV